MEILEGLLADLRAECRDFPAGYRGKVRNSMVDIGLSAVSYVLTQKWSFLSFQHGWSKVTTVQVARRCLGSKSTPLSRRVVERFETQLML